MSSADSADIPTDEAASSRHKRLRWALEQARRDLVDLSRRNRLLHAPLTGKRPWCLAIVGHEADDVFDALYRRENFRGYAFQGQDEENNEIEASDTKDLLLFSQELSPRPTLTEKTNESASRREGRPRLQTRLTAERLEKRLTKIARENRTLEEEQGLTTLHLAIGFLRWTEDERSEEVSLAPLILLPVNIERVQGPDGFVLSGRDDDIIVNVSLREKLKNWGIQLPDIPEGDEWTPSDYFDAVNHVVQSQKKLEVDRLSMGVGFFSFAKFMMWRDLDATTWPATGLLDHKLLGLLLGEDGDAEIEPPIVSDDESIDRKIDLSTAIHVKDADSSQAVVIEEAKRGHNLVVQGPPGTGKSQTITNIIASAVHAGRNVLFVAEKTAALDVVYDRLKEVGLGALCLEMHNRKANKREVINSLDEALRLTGPAPVHAKDALRLADCRDKLNDWTSAIHAPIARSGQTPFDVIGAQLKLRATSARLLDERLDVVADWTAEEIGAVRALTERTSAAITKLGIRPYDHPWFGTNLGLQSPFDIDRLSERLRKVAAALETLSGHIDGFMSHLAGQDDLSLTDISGIVESLRHLGSAPVNCAVLKDPIWADDLPNIERAVADGQKLAALSQDLLSAFHADAWDYDTAPLLLALRADGRSMFRIFSARFRRAMADLRALAKEKLPKTLDERITLIEQLRDAQQFRRDFLPQEDTLSQALKAIWVGMERTSWAEAGILVDWTRTALSMRGGVKLLDVVARAEDATLFNALADNIEERLKAASKAIEDIIDHVAPGQESGCNKDTYQISLLSKLRGVVTAWSSHIGAVNDWVAARNALQALRELELGSIASSLERGDLKPGEAGPAVDLLIAEALWRRAVEQNPDLPYIDGELRNNEIADFRSLDKRRIEMSRLEVLAKYIDQRPNGNAGEMGIIRSQIEKKRGHMSVRKLMEQAGAAVLRLKPVFLMSPLSVAQFLPPEKIKFDLVVIDEASQVAPEDALGAIARVRQFVVVGDRKQLPPTNFFKMVSAGSDDSDEESDEVGNVDRPGDYESILTLARSRGLAERLLAWHYRSKHPSLIALSNEECYGGRLLLPPSPLMKTADFGLSLIKTPRGNYDRGGTSRDLVQAEEVAKEIVRHIKHYPDKTLGVACLSVQQRDAVYDMVDRLGIRSDVDSFMPKGERERLFIKNLEAVQGDERDVIFISVGYGVAPNQSKPAMNFGPVSRDGGDRRLNVLASRARERCVIFSSITSGDISSDRPQRGTRMLRSLLYLAETGFVEAGTFTGGDFDSPFEEAVARVIREAGYRVHSQVGVSNFRIDLGVIDPTQEGRYILGVECDGATYHGARSARDRDRLRQDILEGLGWHLYRIWSTDWFRNPERETQKLLAAIQNASDNIRKNGHRPPVRKDDPISLPLLTAKVSSIDVTQSAVEDSRTPTREYQEYVLPIQHSRQLLEVSVSELAGLARAVLEHEGPIHTEEVARRIRVAFGLQKTGNRILAHVKSALMYLNKTGAAFQDGEFWSIKGHDVDIIRVRRTADLPLRKPDMIAPAEWRFAISVAIREAVSISKSELIVQTARLFGFDRTGAEIEEHIERHLEELISTKHVVGNEDGLMITTN